MPELLILRHAKSDWDDPSLRDIDRPLAARGRKAARMMGTHLAGLPDIDAVWASPAKRVRETLDGIRETCPHLLEVREVPSLYGAGAGTLLTLCRQAREERLMLVGHNPGLHNVALSLTRRDAGSDRSRLLRKFPTAALAVIAFDGDWSHLAMGSASVRHFARPSDF